MTNPVIRRVEPRAPRERGGRIQTSTRMRRDLFAAACVFADQHGVSLGRLIEIAVSRMVHSRGYPQPAMHRSLPSDLLRHEAQATKDDDEP